MKRMHKYSHRVTLSHEPNSGWKETSVEAGSVSAHAHRPAVLQVLARVHPLKQSMGWVVFVHKNALGFFPTTLCEDSVHWREVRLTDPLHSFDDSLKPLSVRHRGVPIPHCDSTGQDAFNQLFVGLREELAFKPSLLQKLDEVQPLLSSFHSCC